MCTPSHLLVLALPIVDPLPATSAPTSDSLEDPPSLRPLTSLKWPYIPDDATYDDPLKRDDPKPLQLHHYEAIATSPAIRTLLKTNPGLRTFLTSIDKLRGTEREEALRLALGVDSRQLSSDDGWHLRSDAVRTQGNEIDEDTRAFKMLAEAIEAAVRDGRRDALGLDWDD
ncbi:hypothetical protein ID866_6339 [Astraeus odoratus]|nr:hypothetical protein ID866_6339 [Astraeus odoratus]